MTSRWPESGTRCMRNLPNAIILCGGAGLRLKSVIRETPKVMACVSGHPFLELLLHQLSRHGFSRVVLAVGFRKEAIRSHFGDSAFGLNLVYSEEDEPLGTGGALGKAAHLLESDTALVSNGDSYTDLDMCRFVNKHKSSQADISLAVVRTDGRRDAGSVFADSDGTLKGFAEKYNHDAAPFINAGIYLFSKSRLREIRPGMQVSLERELLPDWLSAGCAMRVFVAEGNCVDIGTPERFLNAQRELEKVANGITALR